MSYVDAGEGRRRQSSCTALVASTPLAKLTIAKRGGGTLEMCYSRLRRDGRARCRAGTILMHAPSSLSTLVAMHPCSFHRRARPTSLHRSRRCPRLEILPSRPCAPAICPPLAQQRATRPRARCVAPPRRTPSAAAAAQSAAETPRGDFEQWWRRRRWCRSPWCPHYRCPPRAALARAPPPTRSRAPPAVDSQAPGQGRRAAAPPRRRRPGGARRLC